MSKQEHNSKVIWPGVLIGGGDLDGENQKNIRELLNDFGIVLEEEAINANVNIFNFPLFRPFNLVVALTACEVLIAITPGTGMVNHSWLNWQTKLPCPTGNDLMIAVKQQLSWNSVTLLSFPVILLSQNYSTRSHNLRTKAKQWVDQLIQEMERKDRLVRLNPIFRGRNFLIEDNLCFILQPFHEPFIRLYNDHIKPVLQKLGIYVLKADDLFTPTVIIEDIWEYINKAQIIVADVTGRNPNVFYELGIAHTVGKEVVILTQSENDVPFDLRHLRHFTYVDNQQGWQLLERNLENVIRAILNK